MRAPDRAWAWFLGIGVLTIAPYVGVPIGWHILWYEGIAAAGILAMAVGVRRHRPELATAWWWLIAGQIGNLVGDAGYLFYDYVLGDESTPAPYDIPYLLSYVGLTGGLYLLLRRRNRGSDRAKVVDCLIIAAAFALVTWIFLMRPVALSADLHLSGKTIALIYPTLDLLIVAMIAWLLSGRDPRNPAVVMVALNLVAFFVSDYVWTFVENTDYDAGRLSSRLLDYGYLLGYVLFGAAALHPGMARIGRPEAEDPARPIGPLRFLLLTAAALIAPALLWWQARTGNGRVTDAYAIALGGVLIAVLVIVRLVLLVRQVHNQAVLLEEQATRLREVAQQDPLTGLPNRRAWTVALASAIERSRHDGVPLSLAVLDLDYFKEFNDTHGHQAGDRLLKEATAVWLMNIRGNDLLARYGGEEFVALLPGVEDDQAVQLIDRLRPLMPMRCTFSAGVATWNGSETGDELLARADKAMYRAKNEGRNRVIGDNSSVPG